jgi:hypothetical protein
MVRTFENRVLRRIFGPKWEEQIGVERNCIMRNSVICTLRHISSKIKDDEIGGILSNHRRDYKFSQNIGKKSRGEEAICDKST